MRSAWTRGIQLGQWCRRHINKLWRLVRRSRQASYQLTIPYMRWTAMHGGRRHILEWGEGQVGDVSRQEHHQEWNQVQHVNSRKVDDTATVSDHEVHGHPHCAHSPRACPYPSRLHLALPPYIGEAKGERCLEDFCDTSASLHSISRLHYRS